MINLRPHQLSALDAMSASNKGQVIVPTGGGKTICMIEDAKREFSKDKLKLSWLLHLVSYLQINYRQNFLS